MLSITYTQELKAQLVQGQYYSRMRRPCPTVAVFLKSEADSSILRKTEPRTAITCMHSKYTYFCARCYSRYCLEPPLTKMPCAISDPLAHGPHGSSRSESMMIRPPSHIASYQTNHLTSRAILFIIHCDASQASYSFNIVTKVKICSEQPSPVGETHQCPQVSCHLHVRKL